jgi:hypothetical protein
MQTELPAPYPAPLPAPYPAPLPAGFDAPYPAPLPTGFDGPYVAPLLTRFDGPYVAPLLPTAFPAPPPVRPLATPRAGRHAAPARPARRRRHAVLLALLVLVLVGATVAAALLLPGSATRQVDTALDQLRGWSAISVDGYLTGADDGPVQVAATITADGAARGVLTRAGDAQAEFVVGPSGALLRGNAQWWRTASNDPARPDRAALLAGRWVRDPHDGVVDQVVAGRLVPRALADALAGLRDPAQRTRAEVVVDGASGTSFVRLGARLVVGREGRPMALVARLGAGPDR